MVKIAVCSVFMLAPKSNAEMNSDIATFPWRFRHSPAYQQTAISSMSSFAVTLGVILHGAAQRPFLIVLPADRALCSTDPLCNARIWLDLAVLVLNSCSGPNTSTYFVLQILVTLRTPKEGFWYTSHAASVLNGRLECTSGWCQPDSMLSPLIGREVASVGNAMGQKT